MFTLEQAFRSRLVAWLLGLAVFACGVFMGLDAAWAHDEGLLSYGFARAFFEEPLAFTFFLKCKPVFAALYALPASFGVGPFLVCHAALGALAVPLAADAAEAMGSARPNVAALVIATSPFFLLSEGMGFSNGDGVLFGALTIQLAARERHFASGFVAGLAVFVRYETAILAAALLVLAIIDPSRRRLLFGVSCFPVCFWLLGAAYHVDLFWFAHFPPATPAPGEGIASHTDPFTQHSLSTFVGAVVATSPACAFLLASSWTRLSTLARSLLIFVGSFVALFAVTHTTVLPLGPAFQLGFSERYLLVVLAAVAPLAALALDGAASRGAWLGGAALVALAVATRVGWDDRLAAVVALAYSLYLLASRAPRARWAGVAPYLLLLSAPLLSAPALAHGGFRRHGELVEIVRMLERHRDRIDGPVLTTSQLLNTYADRVGALESMDLRYLLAPDQAFELDLLASERHDQRTIVARTLPRAVFGAIVTPTELAGRAPEVGSAFLFARDVDRDDLPTGAEDWIEILEEDHGAHLLLVRAAPP